MVRRRHRAALSAAIALVLGVATSPNVAAMDFFARTNPATLSASVHDLPLIVTEPEPETTSDAFVIWISGDGGWSVLERDITHSLAEAGIPTVAINSFRYFDEHRSSSEIAAALDRVAEEFSQRWGRRRAIFVGYSFGADTGPAALAANEALRGRLDAAIFLSPSPHVYRHEGPTSWLGLGGGNENIRTLQALTGVNIICVRGHRDSDDACRRLHRPDVTQVELPSGHTLHRDAPQITDLILSVVQPKPDEVTLARGE